MIEPEDREQFDQLISYLKEIGKSIDSFETILRDHKDKHWNLVADHEALIDIMNDKLNDQVELSLDSKDINWTSYREDRLALLSEWFQEMNENRKTEKLKS